MSATDVDRLNSPFVVPARFCGPPASGNGGWVSGHAARLLAAPGGPAVRVRLLSPPPLDTAMEVRRDDGGIEVLDGPHGVLRAGPSDAPLADDVPGPVGYAEALAAGERYPGLHDHPFPRCFVCGTERDPEDGLALRPGPVGGDVFAAAWVPREGSVELAWAALDCPGGWAAGFAGRPMVLGTMTAEVHELPEPGAAHVVVAWPRGIEGRKHHSGTALYTEDGRLLARAEAVWIAVDPATVSPARG
ncbi:hypothetical protein [Georgenia thermotolerans]|uniref:hypothetical protein n=1 Tax=Georgenia thermotolerans TaxID=527326 RepID=UPI00186B2584|nr:hypothetical protein [Georgenia thermotolerans]